MMTIADCYKNFLLICKKSYYLTPLSANVTCRTLILSAVERILNRAPSLIDMQATVDRMTALHFAAHCRHYEAAGILIREGANLDMTTVRNETPLMLAVKQGSAAIIELLLSVGARVNCPDENQLIPLHIVLTRCQNVTHQSDLHDVDKANDIQVILAKLPGSLQNRGWVAVGCYLVKCGADVGWDNGKRETPLDCLGGNSLVAELIVEYIDPQHCVRRCLKCESETTVATFLPCGHQILCRDCAGDQETCMKCAKNIGRKVFVTDTHVLSTLSDNSDPSDIPEVSSSDDGRVSCLQCMKRRHFMFKPCQHTCCKDCVAKIKSSLICPFCDLPISEKFVRLFGSSF